MTGQVRTVDGRVAGRRGQETRQKLLDCLSEMLSTSPYRDVKVIDVARMAGTSPATFYQYFPDIEGAVLEIAEGVAKDAARLKELVADRSWAGKSGWTTAEELVDGFLGFAKEHESILRVLDLGTAEGDKRFNKIRLKILNSISQSLQEGIKELQAKGRVGAEVNPNAMAGLLTTLLSSVSGQQKGFEALGVKPKDLKPNLALLIYLGVTGKKPPK
ncbi:TetR family transcriptional regulator [Allostreptomyces psammosilenae]|uniref:AcrR family transcriptional regulator n=1 Tax=Allostreptomyces psammosilenae TaxID=1892865 RepID=A0A853AAV4_9ACTN|nr:TetR family transcriptional regulator [Allostreptomyces psammosilenae]NYI07751.1 AcrR family transcriptional regulator [Allostreptomyces psammosilenae]